MQSSYRFFWCQKAGIIGLTFRIATLSPYNRLAESGRICSWLDLPHRWCPQTTQRPSHSFTK